MVYVTITNDENEMFNLKFGKDMAKNVVVQVAEYLLKKYRSSGSAERRVFEDEKTYYDFDFGSELQVSICIDKGV